MVPGGGILLSLMKLLTPLIKTIQKGDLVWQVIPVPGGFYVEHFNSATDAIEKGYFFETVIGALRCMVGRSANDGSEVDWSSLVVCRQIIAQSEYKNCAREDVNIFRTEDDLAEFKRNRLADYPPHYDDAEEVGRLLEAGEVDKAWDLATSDEAEEKQLWDSHFGGHSIGEHLVSFIDLPIWLQDSIKATVSA